MKIGNITIGAPVPEMAKSVTVMHCLIALYDAARSHSALLPDITTFEHRRYWLRQIVLRVVKERMDARHAAKPHELRGDRHILQPPAIVTLDTYEEPTGPVYTTLAIAWKGRRHSNALDTITFRYRIGHDAARVDIPDDCYPVIARSLRVYVQQLAVAAMAAVLPSSLLDPPVLWSRNHMEELLQSQIPHIE